MRDNPILTLIKTLAFVVLAILVGLSFWQGTKREDQTQVLGERISKVEASIERVNTTLAKLDRRIAKGGVQTSGTNATGGGEASIPPPGEMEQYAWQDEAPPWIQGRARTLWGAYTKENYFKPDPDWPETPDLDDPKLDSNGAVTLWYGSAPPDLNPLTLSDGLVNRYIRTYCNNKWGQPHSQNPYLYKPDLAYRAEHKDHKTWIFWIRPGVRWHTPQVDLAKYPHLKGDHYLTAHDWKFTMDLIMNKEVRASHIRSYFADFERCEVVDDHCFIMHWKKASFTAIGSNMDLISPIPRFVYSLDENGNPFDPSSLGSRYNEHWFGKSFKWVGTGRFVLEKYDAEKEMVVRRNEDYWGDLPAIRTVRREMFPARSLAYTKFEAGEHAYMTYLAPQWKKKIVPNENYKNGKWGEHWGWSVQYSFIAYKNTHPIFRDVNVRHAMTHACNRERILEAVNEGRGVVVTGPQSYHAPTYPKDLKPLAFDLDKASAMLKEAGWTDADGNGVLEKELDGTVTEFRIKAMIPETQMWNTIFSVFREDLAKIGVRMELEPLQWSQFSKRLDDRNFDVTALLWATNGWDNDMTQIWHSSQIDEPESSNFIEFGDAEVDRLIETARATFDLEERIRVQSAAHRRVNALQPYTFLFTIQLASIYWKDKIAPVSLADRWKSRPFVRLWPLWVPTQGPR